MSMFSKSARSISLHAILRANHFLCAVLLATLIARSGSSAETNSDATLSPPLSASDRLDVLLARAGSVTNVTATLERKDASSQVTIDRRPYYRSIPARITRIEQLGTQRSPSGDTFSIVVYALLIDEHARKVYVESQGHLAIFDKPSSDYWLSIVDLLAGKPSRLASTDIELTGVYDIGGDLVGDAQTEVFMMQTRPTRDQKLWVESKQGLVYKARWQNEVYELVGVKINGELNQALFALDVKGKEIPEISEMQVGHWQATTVAPPLFLNLIEQFQCLKQNPELPRLSSG